MTKTLLIFLLSVTLINAGSKKESEYIFTEGNGAIEIKPDFVEMRIGVSTINLNPDSALINTNRIIDSIITTLNTFKTDVKDIETYSASFVKEYENNRDTSTYLGVKSECILKVKYYNVNEFEKMLNLLISKGMNVIQYYEFKHTKEDSLKRIAAEHAFIEAHKNAEAISRKSERKLGKLLNVSYEKPDEYHVRPDFKIELSRKLIGGLMGGDGGGNLRLKLRTDLKYLRIIIPTIKFENNVYVKFELN